MRLLPLAAVLFMAACGQQSGPGASAVDPATVAVSSATGSAVESANAATSTPSSPMTSAATSPTTSPSVAPRPAGLRGMLLTAEELPGARGVTSWRVQHTGKEGSDPFGSCQVTSMSTIGATSVLVRTYDGGPAAGAAQLVARFADPKSAWRSFEVLKSWRDKCASRLGAGGSVSTLATVSAAPATGHRYLVTTGETVKSFEGVGLVRRGEYVSIVLYAAHGSAYSYPGGREPETRAVRAIAQLLG